MECLYVCELMQPCGRHTSHWSDGSGDLAYKKLSYLNNDVCLPFLFYLFFFFKFNLVQWGILVCALWVRAISRTLFWASKKRTGSSDLQPFWGLRDLQT